MVIVKKLYCILPFVYLVNVIVLLVNAVHQYKPQQNSQSPEASWSWKDSLKIIISFLSAVLACILGFYASKFLRREIALLFFAPIVISYWLCPAAAVIPSIITMGSIIGHKNNEKLSHDHSTFCTYENSSL